MTSRLGKRLAEHPALRDLTISETLRQRAGAHSVFLVQYQGRPAYLKLFEGASPKKQAQAVIAATRFATDKLKQSGDKTSNSTAQILLAAPDAGAIVFKPAPGQQLSLLLASATSVRRNELIERAGQWLTALTNTPEAAVFAPYFWLSNLQGMARIADTQIDRPMISHHLTTLSDLAENLRGTMVLRARSHGDFTPDNLFLDGQIMTAIDMQQSSAMPVARDIARFLVWLHSRRTAMPASLRGGVSLSDYNSLMLKLKVNYHDQDQIIRFMIGILLAEVYLDSPGRVLRRSLLFQAMKAWQSCHFSPHHSSGA